MKIINTRLHGIFDYVLSFALVLPWISDYYTHSEDTWVFAAFGAMVGFYSLVTDYELGLIKLLSMKTHLVLDIVTAICLILGPFVFRLPHYYFYWPIAIGLSFLIVAVFSSARPYKLTRKDLDITKP